MVCWLTVGLLKHYEHHTAIAATGSQTMFFSLKEFPSYAYWKKEHFMFLFCISLMQQFIRSWSHLLFQLTNQMLCPKCSGKWTFEDVYLDIEHWLVGRPSTYQPWCGFCSWLLMHLLNWGLYLHQQVFSFFHFDFGFVGTVYRKFCLNYSRHTNRSWHRHDLCYFSGMQSEVLKVHKKTIISVNESCAHCSKPILLMVCKSSLLG